MSLQGEDRAALSPTGNDETETTPISPNDFHLFIHCIASSSQSVAFVPQLRQRGLLSDSWSKTRELPVSARTETGEEERWGVQVQQGRGSGLLAVTSLRKCVSSTGSIWFNVYLSPWRSLGFSIWLLLTPYLRWCCSDAGRGFCCSSGWRRCWAGGAAEEGLYLCLLLWAKEKTVSSCHGQCRWFPLCT